MDAAAKAGLVLNNNKSFHVTWTRRNGVSCLDSAPLPFSSGALRPLAAGETFCYLGALFGASGLSCAPHLETLRRGLANISRSKLRIGQRLVALKTVLLPRLLHPLFFEHLSAALLKAMDRAIRAELRAWLRLPQDTARCLPRQGPGWRIRDPVP